MITQYMTTSGLYIVCVISLMVATLFLFYIHILYVYGQTKKIYQSSKGPQLPLPSMSHKVRKLVVSYNTTTHVYTC